MRTHMRKITLTLLALALALTACESPSVDEDAIRDEIRAEIEAEAGSAAEQVESEVEEAEPEPEPEPEQPHTGDFTSRMHYVDEVIDSTDKVSAILDTAAESAGMVADGTITPGGFADLMTLARETLAGHIEFFESRTPPEGFEESQRAFLRAWRIFDDAFAEGQECGRSMDIPSCERAAELMNEGAEIMGEATALLPDA